MGARNKKHPPDSMSLNKLVDANNQNLSALYYEDPDKFALRLAHIATARGRKLKGVPNNKQGKNAKKNRPGAREPGQGKQRQGKQGQAKGGQGKSGQGKPGQGKQNAKRQRTSKDENLS